MKKVIMYSVAILSIFLTVSCTADELPENNNPVVSSTVSDTGDTNSTPPKK